MTGDEQPFGSDPDFPDSVPATIVITTKNRRDELRTALQSCVDQTGTFEILVIDDGSSDGTSEMVIAEFPAARVVRHDQSVGLIVSRNRAARLATGDVIFSIDDDAVFTSTDILQRTLADFDHPAIGAIAMPYIDINKDDVERQRSPSADRVFIADRFVGTAHAVRRDLFLQLGGYRDLFFHQGEEGDYCARMLDSGYMVRLGNAELIHHFESPKRDTRRMDLYGRRNDILFTWLNVPWTWLPFHLAAVTANGVSFGFRIGRPIRMLQGVLFGYASILRHLSKRRPISRTSYRLLRRLRKGGPLGIEQAMDQLNKKRVANGMLDWLVGS